MTTNVYELDSIHTRQKSFYGKAKVVVTECFNDVFYALYSYDTLVLSVDVNVSGLICARKLWGGYSATTLRHVNELLMQLDFPKLSARVWRAMVVGEWYLPEETPALEKSLK